MDAQPLTLRPDLLAHRYDPGHDAVHFVEADRALRRQVPFLIDEHLPGSGAPAVVARADALRVSPPPGETPIGLIFHSAYCCSTLLANAYDRPGRAFSLKEPMLLNDLVGWRHRGGDPTRVRAVLGDALTLLARPFVPGEVGVIKPSNVVNGLAATMIAERPDAGAVLLHAPLEIYLGSIAAKGLWGRRWVRDLLLKQLIDNSVDLGFERTDYFLQSDLQVAAVGWLAQHAQFARIAAARPDRVRTLNSETLLARPAEALAAVDALFGVTGSDADREKVVGSVFSRNAKSGEAFDAATRAAGQRNAADLYGEEIGTVMGWAEAVSDQAKVSMTLARPLLG